MTENSRIHVVAAVRDAQQPQYEEHLTSDNQLSVVLASDLGEARTLLRAHGCAADVLVVDYAVCGAYETIQQLRGDFPNLLIVLVDDEADFSMPGPADDVSVDPFNGDDLVKRIKRLAEERRVDTLRTDAFPAIRALARALRRGTRSQAKIMAAVETLYGLGYDYVAYFARANDDSQRWVLRAQVGSDELKAVAPTAQNGNSVVDWVGDTGQSRLFGPADAPGHVLVETGQLLSAVCAPVGSTLRFGVIFAGCTAASAIARQDVLMMELVSSQLARALAKESRE